MGQNPQIDNNISSYVFGSTGIPTAYTQGLENLGFLGVPFGSVQQNFAAQQQFQRLLKDIMDRQMQSFPGMAANNINALPFNMRSLMNAAAPLLTDPLYGIEGAQGMLSNGYAYGSLPNNPTRAWDIWQGQQQNPYTGVSGSGYPNYPAPAANAFAAPSSSSPQGTFSGNNNTGGGGSSGGGGGGGGSKPQNIVGSYTVPLAGGGQMTVNANSVSAAQQNANQMGNHPDLSQPVITNRAAVNPVG